MTTTVMENTSQYIYIFIDKEKRRKKKKATYVICLKQSVILEENNFTFIFLFSFQIVFHTNKLKLNRQNNYNHITPSSKI